MAFEVVPYVHLDGGRFPELPEEALETALTRLARRFGRALVVDVAGVKWNQPELETLQACAKRRAVWWDAGSRYGTDAMDLFIAGAESVTLRWNTLKDAKELEELASLCDPASVHLALEHPRGGFLRHPKDPRPLADVARLADQLGVGVVHVLDRADPGLLRALPTSVGPRHVMGPLTHALAAIEEAGFSGALLPADALPPEAPSS